MIGIVAVNVNVAINTFREAIRDRVLYNLVFFALLMISAALPVGQISLGIERLVIINLGLTSISVFGLVMAIFLGVGLIHKEMDKRTLYALLAKPIRRWEFLVGKFAGLVLTLAVNTVFMTFGLAVALFAVGRRFETSDVSILTAVYFILLSLALVTGIALFFSSFSTPMLSTLFTLSIYIAGLFAADIRAFGGITENRPAVMVTSVCSYLLPNFRNFNVMAAVAHGRGVPWRLVGGNTAYAGLYLVAILVGASLIFRHRELK